MTALDLDEAERLSNAATPGPWRVCAMALAVGGATDRTADYLTDRAFVAHARTFVPLAVARIRELEAAQARVGEVLSAEGCSCDCGHDNEGHDDCDRCLGCRVEMAMRGGEREAHERLTVRWAEINAAMTAALALVSEALGEGEGDEGGGATLLDVHERVRKVREERDVAIVRVEKAEAACAAMRERAEKAEAALGRVLDWTVTHGQQLCPPPGVFDTYGEGMRVAKRHAASIANSSGAPLLAELRALRAENERLTARMEAVLHAGPSTAVAVHVFDRAAKLESEVAVLRKVAEAARGMLDDLDHATHPDDWSTSELRSALDAAKDGG